MENKINNFDKMWEDSSFEKLRVEKAKDGWEYAGVEKITMTKFSPEAKFDEILFQNETDIRKKYSNNGKYDVDLILDINTGKLQDFKKILTPDEFDKIIKNLKDEDKNYLVFIREKTEE
jgi:hypothetical protein